MRRTTQPKVVVKFAERGPNTLRLRYGSAANERILRALPERTRPMFRRYPEMRFAPLFSSIPLDQLVEFRDRARRNRHLAPGSTVPDLLTFFEVSVPDGLRETELARVLSEWDAVELAYVKECLAEPPGRILKAPKLHRYPVSSEWDEDVGLQGYLQGDGIGIDALHAWTVEGGNGEGLKFVDVEQGFVNHRELRPHNIRVHGENAQYKKHGTESLGVVVASKNGKGIQGIAWGVQSVEFVSLYTGEREYDPAAAVALAASLNPDVLLVEVHEQVRTDEGRHHYPIEKAPAFFAVFANAAAAGIAVIEPAGNGGLALDTYDDPDGGRIFDRAVRDSGAIMVGAVTMDRPHVLHGESNHGGRVDCYAWGEGIHTCTTDNRWEADDIYMGYYGQTSGAAAIIAGAALSVQGMVKAATGKPLPPPDLREILNSTGTTCIDPAGRPIGVMPDLRRIARQLL